MKMTTKEIEARIEVLERLVSTPITNGMAYALELARLKSVLRERKGLMKTGKLTTTQITRIHEVVTSELIAAPNVNGTFEAMISDLDYQAELLGEAWIEYEEGEDVINEAIGELTRFARKATRKLRK